MTTPRDLAAGLARIAQAEAADVVSPVAKMTGTDTVTSVDGDRCSLAQAGPNFRVAGGLTVVVGDLVAFTRRGTDRIVYAVLGRNALDAAAGSGGFESPMTSLGDLITGGASGTPQRLAAGTEDQVLTVQSDGTLAWADAPGGSGGVSDGDKGDITVSGSGATWTIDNGAVTLAKIANIATARLLGRNTAGAGVIEELDAATARTLLGLVIGTNVQAYHANLAAIADLTSAADRLAYFTGSGTAALATLTSFIRTLLDDTDAATARATLGVPEIRASRTATGSISANSGSDISVSWPSAFADTNYTVSALYEEASITPSQGIVCLLKAKTTTGATIRVINMHSSAHSGTLHAMAVHD